VRRVRSYRLEDCPRGGSLTWIAECRPEQVRTFYELEVVMFNTVVVGADDSSTARQAVVVAADIAQLTGR
jgi:hypothetical protein